MSEAPSHVPEKEDKSTETTELDDLGKRLSLAQKKNAPPPDAKPPGNSYGLAMRLITELVAGVVVGGMIGWTFDQWLGTGPWLLLVFFTLGSGAGLANVVRTAQEMNRNNAADDDGGNGNEHADIDDD